MFEGRCKEKMVSFHLILTGEELYVKADSAKIDQVMHNLVDNAFKFSHSNSEITIETTLRNGKVFVSVKDQGIGIPKESIGRIWERFYKTDASRGKDKKGTGLGLAIVKEIVTKRLQPSPPAHTVANSLRGGILYVGLLQMQRIQKESLTRVHSIL